MKWISKIPYLLAVLLPLTVLTLFLYEYQQEEQRIEAVYDDPAYTTGRIFGYNTVPWKVTYRYKYEVNGVTYEGKEVDRGIRQLNPDFVTETFLVAYRPSDPADSDINTDYQITTDQEFEKLVKEFESSPPAP